MSHRTRRASADAFRHGVDEDGERFIAAFSSPACSAYGPPGSDRVRMPARDLFERAEAAHERVVVDPGAPTQVEIAVGVLPFLPRESIPIGRMRSAPDGRSATCRRSRYRIRSRIRSVRAFAALEDLPKVERAWLLRAGTAWTAGIQMAPDALLGDFDAVRNRLHAVATEHLGSAAPGRDRPACAALRDMYDATAAPYYARRQRGRASSWPHLRRLVGRWLDGSLTRT